MEVGTLHNEFNLLDRSIEHLDMIIFELKHLNNIDDNNVREILSETIFELNDFNQLLSDNIKKLTKIKIDDVTLKFMMGTTLHTPRNNFKIMTYSKIKFIDLIPNIYQEISVKLWSISNSTDYIHLFNIFDQISRDINYMIEEFNWFIEEAIAINNTFLNSHSKI